VVPRESVRPAARLERSNAPRILNPPEEIEAGARQLLAQARGHQLAETRKQLALSQKQIAAAMGVSIARVSQIEHGEVTSFEVIARYVEALGGRLDLVADFGDRTVRLPVSDTPTAA
jgi:predicted XRE-type DNA-binding protein